MRINGRNYLACKALVKDLNSDKFTVEPVLGMKVIKDQERLQSIEERERFDDTTKCILCACCTTSCPSFWANEQYLGPAAIVAAHRFIFDSRDRAAAERLKILNEQFGVYRCHTIFNCTIACPREIEITQAIGEVKRAIATGKLD
jgi:succinate dehydrogenase / fumarate reductase iron-sulfur subunit